MINEHGHGWWLHMLGAVAIMAVGLGLEHYHVLPDMLDWWINCFLIVLGVNSAFWPVREKVQKGKNAPWSAILTFHVFLEWFPAVAVGFIIYWITA